MAKFSNAKNGDIVWSIKYGWGVIRNTYRIGCAICKLYVAFNNGDILIYDAYGCRLSAKDDFVELFWNEFHIPTDEEDIKPFDLVGFLLDNISPIRDIECERRFSLSFDKHLKQWSYADCSRYIDVGGLYFPEDIKLVAETLNQYKVTPDQLSRAYKKLKWI